MTSENIVMANGRILLKKTSRRYIYEVVSVAKNVTYHGLGKELKIGDIVVSGEYIFHELTLDDGIFYVAKPSIITGYIK